MQCRMARSLIALAFAILVAPLTGHAPPLAKVPRVGILIPFSSDSAAYRLSHEAFGQGLHALGYVEGHNIVIEYRSAEGPIHRLPHLAADLVRLEVDVIVTVSTPGALAAQNATQTIPIVFTAVGDPMGSGLVAGLARPGGNITGFASPNNELAEKHLEMLTQAVPSASRVAILWNPDFSLHVERVKALRRAAQALRVELQLVEFRVVSLDSVDERATK